MTLDHHRNAEVTTTGDAPAPADTSTDLSLDDGTVVGGVGKRSYLRPSL